MQQTNANLLVMGQLETTKAFENLDAILEVQGIDAFAWGPNDLAQSMSLPGQPQHPDVLAAQCQVAVFAPLSGQKPAERSIVSPVVMLHGTHPEKTPSGDKKLRVASLTPVTSCYTARRGLWKQITGQDRRT